MVWSLLTFTVWAKIVKTFKYIFLFCRRKKVLPIKKSYKVIKWFLGELWKFCHLFQCKQTCSERKSEFLSCFGPLWFWLYGKNRLNSSSRTFFGSTGLRVNKWWFWGELGEIIFLGMGQIVNQNVFFSVLQKIESSTGLRVNKVWFFGWSMGEIGWNNDFCGFGPK